MEWLKKFRNSALLLTVLGAFLTVFPIIVILIDSVNDRPIAFTDLTEIAMGGTMLLAGIVGVLCYKKQKGMILCLLIGIIALLATGLNIAADFAAGLPRTVLAWFVLAYPIVIVFYIFEAFNLIRSGSAK